ncbi:MAG: hypothetical protein ACR2GY_09170 [Phycisphaerales bacterium]
MEQHHDHHEHEHHDQSEHQRMAMEAAEPESDHAHHDHHSHHDHMVADFRQRFWVSLVLTVPVIALAPMIQRLVGLEESLHFPGDSFVQFAFATAVYFYGGWPFLKGLFDELRKRLPGMMTLIFGAEWWFIKKEAQADDEQS